jgi:hypothetical protein
MPIGYSIEIERRKLEAKLRQEKATELAQATEKDRNRIEKEIKAEAKRRTKKLEAKLLPDKIFPWLY